MSRRENYTERLKGSLTKEVFLQYINSVDFNGLPLKDVKSCPEEIIVNTVIDLIEEDKVCIIISKMDANPHINKFGFLSKEEQLNSIRRIACDDTVVLYPSNSYLRTHIDDTQFQLFPFKRMMALGHPQLSACYFEYDVLQHYVFNPQIEFKFSDYYGCIHSSENSDSRRCINLKTFGIGRNEDKLIIVSYPRYLQNMSSMNQLIWQGYLIEADDKCKVLKDYKENEFYNSWNFPQTIYRAILQEISNICELSIEAFGVSFFRKTYKKEELPNYDILPFPSSETYYQFLLLMEKIIVSNINPKFFENSISTKDETGKQLGTLACLKLWLTHVNDNVCEEICDPLNELRYGRQTPAHKIYDNVYTYDFLSKQHELCKSIYNSLHLLRCLLQTHHKVEDFVLKYPNTKYYEV